MLLSVPIARNVEAMTNDEILANRFLQPSDDFGQPGSGYEPPCFTDQRQGGKSVDDTYDLESAISTSTEEDVYQNFNTGHKELYKVSHQPISS